MLLPIVRKNCSDQFGTSADNYYFNVASASCSLLSVILITSKFRTASAALLLLSALHCRKCFQICLQSLTLWLWLLRNLMWLWNFKSVSFPFL